MVSESYCVRGRYYDVNRSLRNYTDPISMRISRQEDASLRYR